MKSVPGHAMETDSSFCRSSYEQAVLRRSSLACSLGNVNSKFLNSGRPAFRCPNSQLALERSRLTGAHWVLWPIPAFSPGAPLILAAQSEFHFNHPGRLET